jgi:hypothetical protein
MRDRPRPPLDAAKIPGKGVTHGCQPRDLLAFFYVPELLTFNQHAQARDESTASKPVIKHPLIIIKLYLRDDVPYAEERLQRNPLEISRQKKKRRLLSVSFLAGHPLIDYSFYELN